MTTADVARVLGIYRTGVHWLEAQGRLDCERTMSGQRMFARQHVLAVAAERTEARLVPVRRVIVGRYEHTQLRLPIAPRAAAERLRDVRLRMAKAGAVQAKRSLDKCPVKARGIA